MNDSLRKSGRLVSLHDKWRRNAWRQNLTCAVVRKKNYHSHQVHANSTQVIHCCSDSKCYNELNLISFREINKLKYFIRI